jgi:glycine oxidase
MLAPGGEFEPGSRLAFDAIESLRLYPEFVDELTSESGIAIDYRPCGAIEWPAGAASEMQRRAEGHAAAGVPALPQHDGSILYPQDAVVDPRQIMAALAEACRRRGVQMLERTRVENIETKPGGAVAAGISARTAVLAAGAWSSSVRIPGFAIPEVFPVRGHLLGYRLEPGLLHRIVRRGHTYVFQRTSGYVIAGSDAAHAGFDRGPDPAVVESIRKEAGELVPLLASRQPDDVWTGFRPATDFEEPQVRRLEESRIWIAYGHYRNGILFAPHTAGRVAAEISASLQTD